LRLMRSSFRPKPSEVVNETVPASLSRNPTGATAVITVPPAGVTYASAVVRSPATIASTSSGHRTTPSMGRHANSTLRPMAMNVLVTASHGLIGSALSAALESGGNSVRRLVRREPKSDSEFRWDPARGQLDERALGDLDGVVHLSGETVAGRWTAAKKERILASRVNSTMLLSEALAEHARRPRALVVASAVGYYGNRGDETLTEASAPGAGFLADVVRQWEAASAPAEQAGIRVVRTRFGIVLSPAGGALGTMLRPFRLGLGGKIGSGRQFMSWVAIDDVVGGIQRALSDDSLSGPVNVVAPAPVTNQEFTRTLGRVLHRPTVLTVPAPTLRLVLGEFATEAIGGARVLPAKLEEVGYEFRQPRLEGALRHVLGR
jgi:uncharacterized protein (TIGR01777 family)